MANVKVFLKLFRATNDKTVEFNVADPKNIKGVETQMEIKQPDLSFDDSYYTIEEEEKKEDKVDTNSLVRLAQKLKEERDGLEVKIMEKKPLIIKLIKGKFTNNDPKLVTYSTKEAGVPESLIKEASQMEELPDVSDLDYPLDKGNEFLQKVAGYGRMNERIAEIDDKLEKISSILGTVAKNPLKTMYIAGHANKVRDNTEKFSDKIKNPEKTKDKKTGYSNKPIKRQGYRA